MLILTRYETGITDSSQIALTLPTTAFQDRTTALNQRWQTDFTSLKSIGWGWMVLSTLVDDFSRSVSAWQRCTSMTSRDITATLEFALQASGCDPADVVQKPG